MSKKEEKKDVVESVENADSKKSEKKEQYGDFTVAKPLSLVKEELPLVVSGKFKNKAQEEYAQTLNGYAYANPKKWEKKKDVLMANLVRLGDEPELLTVLNGNGALPGQVKVKNTLIQTEEDRD